MTLPNWQELPISDCLSPLSLSGKAKIQARDYKDNGKFPIVDQGQELISGWTDNEQAVITEDLPLIVFGDHTRALKFLDRPFVRGADGTQVLKPKSDLDPLFFYYACKWVDVPSRGYNRHFGVLKESTINVPGKKPEQEAIGLTLRLVDEALGQQVDLIDQLQKLKSSAMHTLFSRGLRGEPQRESEIGMVPESWDVKTIGEHHSVVSGGTPSRGNSRYWAGGTIPWVKTTEVSYCVINETEEHITQAGLADSAAKMLPKGTLLMAMYGQGVTRGKVAILGIEAACNQACAAINPSDDVIDTRYLYHFLTYRYDAIRQLAHGGQQQNLNLEIVRDLPVAFPGQDKDEQAEIVAILDAIDQKIDLHKRKRTVLEELFKSLLHKLMTGEVRVADLNLTALGVDPLAAQEVTQ